MRGTQFGLMKWKFGWRLTLVSFMVLAIIGTMFTAAGTPGIPGIPRADIAEAVDLEPDDWWIYNATSGSNSDQWRYTNFGTGDLNGEEIYYQQIDFMGASEISRNAAGQAIKLKAPLEAWQSTSDWQYRMRKQTATSLGMTIKTTVIFSAHTPASFGAPFVDGETWSYHEFQDRGSFGLNNDDFDVVVDGTEEVTVPAGTFDCHKVVITRTGFSPCTSTEWWSINPDLPFPVKVVDACGFDDPQTLELVDSNLLSAATPTYDLTTASSTGGSVTDPGEPGPFTYDESEEVNLVAQADTGYTFVNWTGTGVNAGDVANASAASTSITMNADYSVMANFAEVAGEEYNLTTASGDNGSVTTPGEPGPFGPYSAGTPVDLVATPDTGYMFDQWTGTGVDASAVANPNAASTTINMNADYSVTASFVELVQYDLTTASDDNGSVTTPGEPGPFTYNGGESASLVATPDSGYVFDQWTGTGVDASAVANSNAASTTITMNADYSVTANFVEAPAGWNCPVDHVALIAPYANNGRAQLAGTVQISAMSFSGDWFMILELDEASGGWFTYYSGFTTGNTLTQLEPGKYYYVVVSEPGFLYY